MRLAPAPREPRQAELAYIRDLRTIWRQAQSLLAHAFNPLIDVWPTDMREDVGTAEGMSDVTLQHIWPSIDPRDLRTYAPWATSRDEVVRAAFPGHMLPASDHQVEAFVQSAIETAKLRPWTTYDIEPFTPSVPSPFRIRPAYTPPMLIDDAGRVIPPPPRPRIVTTNTIHRQIEYARVALAQQVNIHALVPVVTKAGERVNRWCNREVQRVLTIDPRGDPRTAYQLQQWGQMNANLIETGVRGPIDGVRLKSLLSDVADTLETAHAAGTRVEVLAHQIMERYEVSDSRAKLIARDQTLKLNGQLNRSKQQAAGVTQYRWITSRDEKVRPSHQRLNDTIQSWDVPPPPGHPGDDYQCRCTAQPIIPELEASA